MHQFYYLRNKYKRHEWKIFIKICPSESIYNSKNKTKQNRTGNNLDVHASELDIYIPLCQSTVLLEAPQQSTLGPEMKASKTGDGIFRQSFSPICGPPQQWCQHPHVTFTPPAWENALQTQELQCTYQYPRGLSVQTPSVTFKPGSTTLMWAIRERFACSSSAMITGSLTARPATS